MLASNRVGAWMGEFDSLFLNTELNTGLTFCRIALRARDAAKRERNRANALEAYKSLLRFSGRAALSPAQAQTLQNGIAELRRMLDRLSETQRERERERPWNRQRRRLVVGSGSTGHTRGNDEHMAIGAAVTDRR